MTKTTLDKKTIHALRDTYRSIRMDRSQVQQNWENLTNRLPDRFPTSHSYWRGYPYTFRRLAVSIPIGLAVLLLAWVSTLQNVTQPLRVITESAVQKVKSVIMKEEIDTKAPVISSPSSQLLPDNTTTITPTGTDGNEEKKEDDSDSRKEQKRTDEKVSEEKEDEKENNKTDERENNQEVNSQGWEEDKNEKKESQEKSSRQNGSGGSKKNDK